MDTKVNEAAPATAPTAEPVKTEVNPVAATPTPEAAKPTESMVTSAEPKESLESKEAKPAVPEKYELKLPADSKLDAAYVAKVESLAKEKGWSNERAQESIDDRHAAITEYEQQQAVQLATFNDKTWKEELMNDPDVGGQKFEESGHLAFKGAEWLFGKEGAAELKAMKLNHNPMLFKGCVKLGRANESDKIVIPGDQTTSGKLPLEQQMYPNMFKKEK